MRHLTPCVIAALALAALAPHPARACGGLFCSSVSPTPVDQNAERILFEVNDDLSVTATVEIKYRGDPSVFSWILPVPGTPDAVDVASASELGVLDALTRPSFLPPTQDFSNCGGSFFGCSDAALPGARAVDDESTNGGGDGGINVTNFDNVGPFTDIILVEGADPELLVEFLNTHEYLVTDAMRPFIEEYTREGQKFLAVQLQPDASIDDIVPLRFHCPAPNPTIPLRLTAIASEPEMSIAVFVLAPQRYTPANYGEIVLSTDDVHMDDLGTTNYFPLVSKRIDQQGGLAFVVERAAPSSSLTAGLANIFLGTEDEAAAKAAVEDLLARRPYLTRLYTRMSADEMFTDPFFIPSDDEGDVSGTLDFSSRVVDVCDANSFVAPACGTLYCGETDRCATTASGVEGCACGGARVARAITSPTGGAQVVCTAPDLDVLGEAGPGATVCAGFDCGAGFCLPVNGTATCNCDDGAAAIISAFDGRVTCVAAQQSFPAEQVEWPSLQSPDTAPNDGGCAQTHKSLPSFVATLALLFGATGALRRVLRRRDGKLEQISGSMEK